MPTGYTSDIKNGISFKNFALTCARAFGSCVTLRDDTSGPDIPVFKPNPYALDELNKSKKKLEELSKMSLKQAKILLDLAHEKSSESLEKSIKECQHLRQKYSEMAIKVHRWNPPTEEHECLKEFMLDQIKQSIEYDCNESYYIKQFKMKDSPEEWLSKEIAEAKKDVEYYQNSYNEEIARVNERNEWVSALKKSLK